ncbi:N-acetylglucosamine-6-phosphate deacetylase [Paludisphaera rhizosphaerae]|uniref:N-acetylglucosamine-6-phosphate deacetylase n=1 Tax=Paludisphaera rhizosphaerae TaxID=2711216 RepID=UPI0013E9CD2C|nr:N-acetylglucosamine-6-phosphate deacetylase [Paludisphaera rhizosphaerae]
MIVTARDWNDGRWIEVEVVDGAIARVEALDPARPASPDDPFIAPAFWDIQTNGRWGHSFSSSDLTVEQVVDIVRAQRNLGAGRICPTLITAPPEHTLHGLRTIAQACDENPDVDRMVVGIHLEGPFLSEKTGYRGTHPAECMRDPDWSLFEKFQEASGGRVVLMTLAPEREGSAEFIRRAVAAGIAISLGHTATDADALAAAVDAGATLSTHLGNGIVAELPRHPNPIWLQAAEDRLYASLIADGHHLGPAALRVFARAKGWNRLILVSDAGWLAGLPAGNYGAWDVDPSGKIVLAGTPYLAGSALGLEVGLRVLDAVEPAFPRPLLDTVTTNPARLLKRPEPRLAVGEPAEFVLLRRPAPGGLTLERTCIGGEWFERAD